jgi:type IV pilus assembly protein PilQ
VVVSLTAAKPAPLQLSRAEAPAPAPEAAPAPEPIVVEGAPADHAGHKLLGVLAANRENGGAVLNLKTDGAVARYEVQEVQNPTRLVVDLFGIADGPKKMPALKSGPLSRVRVGKHEDHLRVVLDARGDTLPHFDVVSTEEGVTVAFSGRDAPATAPARKEPDTHLAQADATETAPSAPAPGIAAAAAQDTQVEDIRFDEKGGFYRLKISARGPINHTLTLDNPRLKVLELEGATLPKSLERSLDTTAFAGPVQAVATFHDPDRKGVIKVAVDLQKAVEHRVWTKGDALYWDFRLKDAPAPTPAAADADQVETRTAGFAVEAVNLTRQGTPSDGRYSGKRITIDLKDADILNVLRLIAEVSKLNVIASDEVKGLITIKLRNVPWDQALDIILKVKALGQERNGNIIRVAPLAILRTEKEQRDKERLAKITLDPTLVKLLPVNYAAAQEMLPQVQALLSTRGKATVDKRTNVIIVEDVKDNIFQAERLVRTLDTQTPQVMIEARIVEASAEFTRSLGIQWGYGVNFSEANGNPTGLIFPHNVASAGGADDPAGLGTKGDPGVAGPSNFAVNLPANPSGGVNSSAMGFNFGSIGNAVNVSLRLSAAESDGLIKVISSPRVATLDNKLAKISQGVDIPVARVGVTGVQTQLIPSALELEVTPHVTADGSVLMKLRITNNQPDFSRVVQGIPTFTKKEADTEVMVRDGETTVVGGIYTRNVTEDYKRSPFMGNLPVIGWLFKSQTKRDVRQELLAFITPRIANRSSSSVAPGTELGAHK